MKLRPYLLLLLVPALLFSADKWYKNYEMGLKAVEQGDWQVGVDYLNQALTVKNEDSNKTRAFGAIFIEYYPNREIGVCYFHLGQNEKARQHLSRSMQQAPTDRADEFLKKIGRGEVQKPVQETPLSVPDIPQQQPREQPKPDDEKLKLIGERLSLAALPFQSKGISGEIGDMDLLDKMITALVNVNRFKVVERAQLERILDEQKLGMSGILDASTAARVGRGIGVDVVVLGSVTRSGNTISTDARMIDTETAAILSAQDAWSTRLDIQSITEMIYELANKIKSDFPIVHGYVINTNNSEITLDIGLQNGIRKGTKCHVYREGESIVHPVTGMVIGRTINEICEVQVVDVYSSYSLARITKPKKDMIKNLDRVITK